MILYFLCKQKETKGLILFLNFDNVCHFSKTQSGSQCL